MGYRRLPHIRAEDAVSCIVVASSVVFVLVQLKPSLFFGHTTPTGGDTGAHVLGPRYLRDHLLPHGRVTGWSWDWFGGFPIYTFYFPVPALLVAGLDLVLPYTVAFKLVTASGPLSLPLAAYAFGRLTTMPFPTAPLLGVATVPFLFDRWYTNAGGNLASTLAGEFSFSIGMSLALLFLGVFSHALESPARHRRLAALLLALTVLSHVISALFAACGALVLLLLRSRWRRVRSGAVVLLVGGLLSAFWSLPAVARSRYTTSLGHERVSEYRDALLPHELGWLFPLAAAGAVGAVVWRHRAMVMVALVAVATALAFVLTPQGRLWNGRLLPFWYLCLYLLAGIAVALASELVARHLGSHPRWRRRIPVLIAPLCAAVAAWLWVGAPLGTVPHWIPTPVTRNSSYIPSWVKRNYGGYERTRSYPEYRAVVEMMAQLGRSRGCGRAHWEYEPNLDRFGTPLALSLLPYWTDGCIASMDGIYYESSATTPYHLLSGAELSAFPARFQRRLPYRSIDVAAGVDHLQLLGVRYYLAFSPEAVSQATSNTELSPVASSGLWRVFEVSGSELVSPLQYEPVVVTGLGRGESGWLDTAVGWYQQRPQPDVFLAADGPRSWPRLPATALRDLPRRAVPGAGVSGVRVDGDLISFDVDRPGSPVLVKASYFPNWRASGARGPWRLAPNLMVVVPTSTHVVVRYGWTDVDSAGWVVTAMGLAALARVRPPRPLRRA